METFQAPQVFLLFQPLEGFHICFALLIFFLFVFENHEQMTHPNKHSLRLEMCLTEAELFDIFRPSFRA
jgi:hypothetical protein